MRFTTSWQIFGANKRLRSELENDVSFVYARITYIFLKSELRQTILNLSQKNVEKIFENCNQRDNTKYKCLFISCMIRIHAWYCFIICQ